MERFCENFLWTEAYRPKRVADAILPAELKKTFQNFVNQKNIPNLLLAGGPGVGKTTVARAMLEELDCDYLVVNGSLNGNIDTLRNEILNFATSVSFKGTRKYVILDEADYLNPNSVMPALRNFMEEYSKNCGFILTCNFKNRIIAPLHSRCTVIDFKIDAKEKSEILVQFLKRSSVILKGEGIEFDIKVVAEVIKKYYPDWRRALNELQRYSSTGKIDTGILTNLTAESFEHLVKYMKEKNFTEVRKWVGENSDTDTTVLFRHFYDHCNKYFKPESAPELILALSEGQFQHAFVADPEINLTATLAKIMVNCAFL